MERRNAPHPLLFWSATIGSLALLIVALLLLGAKGDTTVDKYGGRLRSILGLPIDMDVMDFPVSPKGTWRVKVITRWWSWYGVDSHSRSSEVVVVRSGRPFLRTQRLDPVLFSHRETFKTANWITDSILSLHEGSPSGGATTFTLVNDSGRTVPCVQVLFGNNSSDYCFFFDVPAHSTQQVHAVGPDPGCRIHCELAPERLCRTVDLPPGLSSITLTGVRITIRDVGPPEIEFTTATASTAAAP